MLRRCHLLFDIFLNEPDLVVMLLTHSYQGPEGRSATGILRCHTPCMESVVPIDVKHIHVDVCQTHAFDGFFQKKTEVLPVQSYVRLRILN